MALSIVVSQSPRRSPTRQALEEELITALLMEDGAEVSVVSHLEDLEAEDTGLMCLQGITAHLVLMSWMAPLDAYRALQRLGISGRCGRTRHCEDVPSEFLVSHPRTIYCLALDQFENVAAGRAEVARIRQEQAVTVFQIGGVAGSGKTGGGANGRTGGKGVATTPAKNRQNAQNANDVEDASETAAIIETPASPAPPESTPGSSRSSELLSDDEVVERQLDALIDELDDLDV